LITHNSLTRTMHRILASCTLLVCLFAVRVAATRQAPPRANGSGASLMPVSEVKAGMRGKGITVFQGQERTEFDVEILGVLENVVGPRRNLVLARLSGHRLAETGVMQGMSGSPVYIGGRLLGAISYSLGSFSKEPIAGITPIGEMVDLAGAPAARPASARAMSTPLRWPQTRDDFVAAVRETFARLSPAGSTSTVNAIDLRGLATVPAGATLQPIATPFTMSGFSGETQAVFGSVLNSLGVANGLASPAPAAPASNAALAPGDAVGVSLISGDLSFGATGTVTYVDGNRVYAFGHPFFNLGPTEFPMTKAYVQTLLPSLLTSAKLAAIGEVVGTFSQDRSTGIGGTLGSGPDLVPVSLTLNPERGAARTFRFSIVKDQLFTPLLTFASIVNTLQSYEREFGAATFAVRGKAVVRDHDPVALEDIFTGDTPGIGAAAYVAGPLNLLLRNDLDPVQIEAVELAIDSFEEPRTSTIERVWVDTREPKPGDTLNVRILTRSYRGIERTQTLALRIPSHARGTVSIVVSDGTKLAQLEQRDFRQPRDADSVDQMIRAFNRTRRNNRIYVKLIAPSHGAVVNGEQLSALPPSVLAVIEGDQPGGNVLPLTNAVLGEWELPAEQAITGQRTLSVALKAP
jgi:SpoIVB peptidase S55